MKRIPILLEHDQTRPIGEMLLREDLDLDLLFLNGEIDVGGIALEKVMAEDGSVVITKFRLLEVSLMPKIVKAKQHG